MRDSTAKSLNHERFSKCVWTFFLPSIFFGGNAVASGQTEVFFPQVIRGNSQNTTRILVQNQGELPATVTVQFFDQSGHLQETDNLQELAPNGSTQVVLGGVDVPLSSRGHGKQPETPLYFRIH
ncbi:MAG: hypothetical protein ACE5JX_12715, partial [Acidobacteriota bacterium]